MTEASPRKSLAAWWAGLEPAQRQHALDVHDAGQVPAWMVTSLTDRGLLEVAIVYFVEGGPTGVYTSEALRDFLDEQDGPHDA